MQLPAGSITYAKAADGRGWYLANACPSSVGRVPQSCRGTWGGCLRVRMRFRRPATPQYCTLLARMPPRAHDGTDGGDPAPGVPTSLRARCTCPGLQGFWLRSVRDLGAAAHGGAESTNRSAASHLVSAATRSLQPPSCPLSERRRATPHTPPFSCQVEVGRRAGLPVDSVAPRLISLRRSLSHLALPRAVALKVQRTRRVATNTDHIHPRVARSEGVKQGKGQCQRPHRILGPSRVEKRGVQMQ